MAGNHILLCIVVTEWYIMLLKEQVDAVLLLKTGSPCYYYKHYPLAQNMLIMDRIPNDITDKKFYGYLGYSQVCIR